MSRFFIQGTAMDVSDVVATLASNVDELQKQLESIQEGFSDFQKSFASAFGEAAPDASVKNGGKRDPEATLQGTSTRAIGKAHNSGKTRDEARSEAETAVRRNMVKHGFTEIPESVTKRMNEILAKHYGA